MSKQLVATIVGNSNYDESYSSKTKHYSQRMVCGLPQQCLICGLYLTQILQWIWYFLFTVSGRETDSLSWIDEPKDMLQHVLLQTLSILTHWDLVGHPTENPMLFRWWHGALQQHETYSGVWEPDIVEPQFCLVRRFASGMWLWIESSGQTIATSHDRISPKR